MAEVALWLSSTAFTAGGAAVTWGAVVQTALVIGYGVQSRNRARAADRAAKNALLDSIEDRTQMFRAAVAEAPSVYGRARLSGVWRPVGVHGADGELFSLVVALCDAVDGFDAIWLGDYDWTDAAADGNGWATTGRFFNARNTPVVVEVLVGANGTASLGALAYAVQSVALSVRNESQTEGELTFGAPNASLSQYALDVVGGQTQIIVNGAHAGRWLSVYYLKNESQSLARIVGRNGQPGQVADPYLVAQFPGVWGTKRRGDDVADIVATFAWDEDALPTGIPNLSAIPRGRRVYDPRTGTTVYSRNPALHARDWIIRKCAATTDTIDEDLLIAAANACDEWVELPPGVTTGDFQDIGGTLYQRRYTFDGVLTGVDPLGDLEKIATAMGGTIVESGGVWSIWAGVYVEPELALDDDDLADGTIEVTPFSSVSQLFNSVSGKYMHPTRWVADAFAAYSSPTYIAQDGGRKLVADLDLTMINDPSRAQRVARLHLHRSRQALTITAQWNLGAYEVSVGQTVEVTLARYGQTAKVFRVLNRSYDPAGPTTLVLREEAAAVYAWDFDETVVDDPAPNTSLPDHREVAPPVLTFASGLQYARRLADGSVSPFMRIAWAPTDISITHIELQWRRAVDTAWQMSGPVPADHRAYDVFGIASAETLIVWGRAINGIGVRSEWVAFRVEVDPGALANIGSGGFGAGVNLLSNARLLNTANGFHVTATADGSTFDVQFNDRPVIFTLGNGKSLYALRVADGTDYAAWPHPSPHASMMILSGLPPQGVEWAYAISDDVVPISSGDRIEAQARIANSAARARLKVAFYDVNGALMAIRDVTGGEASSNAFAPGPPANQAVNAMTLLWGFVEPSNVPAGATGARWMITHTADDLGGQGGQWTAIAHPYLGIALEGQSEPSPWTPGPSGGAIEGIDAVTEIISSSLAQLDMTSVATANVFAIPFTPGLDGTVEVSFAAAMSAIAQSSIAVSKGYCGFTGQIWRGAAGSGVLIEQVSTRSGFWSSADIGQAVHDNGSLLMTASVEAGLTYTAIVSASRDAAKFSSMTVYDARLRITEVYR